ncbi:MAG: ATP-binding cassette domain-containing protein [Chloroflexota bacterium]
MRVLLRVSHLSKQFGTLTALNNIQLDVYPGEVVGLAGVSGAGKSLLLRTIAGEQTPDSGRFYFDGSVYQWPFHAEKLGIGMIHREPELAELFDVTSNIFLGHELGRSFLRNRLRVPNQAKMDVEAEQILSFLGVRLSSLRDRVGSLPNEQRQLVAIAQAMVHPVKLRLVDNADLLLSYPYQEKLLDCIGVWQRKGTAVLYSSDNLDHLFAVSDRLVVMRQGQIAANVRTDETNREEIVTAMVSGADRQQRTPVIWALDSYYQARKQAETLQHNQVMLQRNLATQDNINRQLLDQLSDQVSALDSANLALQDAQRRLLTEREQERKRLARELHDETIQELLGLNYQLEEIAEDALGDPALAEEIEDVRHNIRSLVESLRRICRNLRPPTIDSLGLGAALQSFTHTWSERTGIETYLHLDENLGRLPETIELSIFRIVQESLSNIWKHSSATIVTITLEHISPRMLRVSILDDGMGLAEEFDLARLSQNGHYGLLGISERVALLGGRLRLQNQPEGGLLVQVEIPHPRVIREEMTV